MLRRLLLVMALLPASAALAAPRPLEIYFIDVEGGAATLIVTPAGESVLVDTGWPRDDARDARRIAAAARQAGLQRIDYLITTHYHRDHFGGLAELVKLIPVGRFYDHGRMSELSEDLKSFPGLNEAYLKAAGGRTQTAKPGEEIALKGAPGSSPIRLLFVSSHGETLPGKGAENPECRGASLQAEDTSDNARSVGFVLSLGRFRFVDLGDLTWNTEQRLVCPSSVLGRADLYQVTHHGMNTSNNTALLRSIRPQVAVMNNGPRKAGHPDVVKALRALPSVEDLYQGHKNLASRDEENVSAEFIANLGPEDGCAGHVIKASVAPDGSSYTVTNGRTGTAKTYKTRS